MAAKENVKKLNCPDFFDKYPRPSGAALRQYEKQYGYLNNGSEELELFNKKELDCRKKRAIATTKRAPTAKPAPQQATVSSFPRVSPVASHSLVKEEVPIALEVVAPSVKRPSQEVLDDSFTSFISRLEDTSSLVFNKILDGLSAKKLLDLINEEKLTNKKEDKLIRKRIATLHARILKDYLANHYQIKLHKRPPTDVPTTAPYYDYICIVDGIQFKAVLGPNWPRIGQQSHREDYAFKFIFEPIQINEPIFNISLLINLQKGNWPPSIQVDTIYKDSWNGPYTVPVPTFQSLLRITYITFMMYWKTTIKKETYYKRVTNHMITDQIYNTGSLRFAPVFRRHYSVVLKDTPFPQTNEVLQTTGLDLQLIYANKPNPLGIMIDRPYHITPYKSFANPEGSFVVKSLIRFGEGVGDHSDTIDIIYDGTSILIQYDAIVPFREFFQMMKLVNIDGEFINNMIYFAVASIYMNIPTILHDMEVQPNVEILRQLLSNITVEFKVVPASNPVTRIGLIA